MWKEMSKERKLSFALPLGFILLIAWLRWCGFMSTKTVLIVVTVVGLLLFVAVMIYCCNSTNDRFRTFIKKCCGPEPQENTGMDDGKISCYLCHTSVPIDQWNCGEHRRECASSHADKLRQMTKYRRKLCPKCDQRLRIWPAENEVFYCDNNRRCRQEEGRAIINHGYYGVKRLNCFQCDIDFCLPCIEAEIGADSNQAERAGNLEGVGNPDINPTDPKTTPWIPSAPPEEEYSTSTSVLQLDNGCLNPPSYEEAILITAHEPN